MFTDQTRIPTNIDDDNRFYDIVIYRLNCFDLEKNVHLIFV